MKVDMTFKQRIVAMISLTTMTQVIAVAIILTQLIKIEHHISAVANSDIPITKAITSLTEHQLEQEIQDMEKYTVNYVVKLSILQIQRKTENKV